MEMHLRHRVGFFKDNAANSISITWDGLGLLMIRLPKLYTPSPRQEAPGMVHY